MPNSDKTTSKLRFALTTAGVIAAVSAISVASAASMHSGSVSNSNSTSTSISIGAGYSKNQCMNNGWKAFGVFKNQGDCVSFFATGGKNPPAGTH